MTLCVSMPYLACQLLNRRSKLLKTIMMKNVLMFLIKNSDLQNLIKYGLVILHIKNFPKGFDIFAYYGLFSRKIIAWKLLIE